MGDDDVPSSKRQKVSTQDDIVSEAKAPEEPQRQETHTPHNTATPPSLQAAQHSPSTADAPLTEEQLAAQAEAAQDAADAPLQAENGIAVDTSSERDPFSDDGYETDSNHSVSTSLSSSMFNYVVENGRRYHRFREGKYNFPNDDAEQEREDMKHAMIVNLCQALHFAPVEHPQNVLDMGTGTGIWAIEMGDQYPSSAILGVDLSPIQPAWVPPNVKFMVDDIESPWLHPQNHFDLIHSRHIVMAIKDWPNLLRNAYDHLKPGGWLELQEVHHFPQASSDTELDLMEPLVKFWANVSAGLGALGVDFTKTQQLAQLVRDAGFVNVTERIFHIPIGTWPKNKTLKICGLWWKTILMDGLSPIALGPFTRGLGWTRDEVEAFLVNVRKSLKETPGNTYMPLHIIYAQKPE